MRFSMSKVKALILSVLVVQSLSIHAFEFNLQVAKGTFGKIVEAGKKEIEKGIEKGFKKAKIQNYIKMPPIDIGHYDYKNRGLT